MPQKDSNSKSFKKDFSFDPFFNQKNNSFYFKNMLPKVLMLAAMFIVITQIVIPLTFYKSIDNTMLGFISGFREFKFSELNTKAVDLTQSNIALAPIKNKEEVGVLGIRSANIPPKFFLSIPKLNIENAIVETNSLDLSPDDRLGHYNGSKLPGQNGNIFIYGHSVLSVFYNPKNYKTIFSTLNRLEEGDKVALRYNNVLYTYTVFKSEVKKTEDINVLENVKSEFLNDNTITLMTCWPAGLKSKRYLVYATLD